LGSLNAQAQAPDDPSQILLDFHLLSLRVYMEMLLTSFNAQEQAPDDIHAQDRQWAPCLFVENFRHCSQEPARLPTKHPHLSRQQLSQVSAQELSERVLILPYHYLTWLLCNIGVCQVSIVSTRSSKSRCTRSTPSRVRVIVQLSQDVFNKFQGLGPNLCIGICYSLDV
jgi:hypothetical protein